MSYPPVFARERGPVKRPPTRFTCLPTLRGTEVIDHDGRAVHYAPSADLAQDKADALNEAALAGSDILASMIARLR